MAKNKIESGRVISDCKDDSIYVDYHSGNYLSMCFMDRSGGKEDPHECIMFKPDKAQKLIDTLDEFIKITKER